MRKAFTLFALLLAFLTMQVSAQERTITGKVISSQDNLGIPGTSVVVTGTTIGTLTDIDGNYKLNVPAETKAIRFTSVGMKSKTVELTAANVIDVTLDLDVLKLDEVVVTALGIKTEKKRLGFAVQDVQGNEISKSGETNVIQSLAGKVAGVEIISSSGIPGASSFINIRGYHSLGSTSASQPLMVIDGIPIDNSYSSSGNPDDGGNNLVLQGAGASNRGIDIDPNDIESVSILKGPAASALYGIQAANGVIVITTKKGRPSGAGNKLNVSYSSTVQFDKVSNLPKLQNKYAQGSGGVYRGPSTLNRNSWGPAISTLSYDHDIADPYNSFGKIVSSTDPGADEAAKAYDPYDFFKTGSTFTNSVNFSGGTDLATFYVSASHYKQNGIVPKSTYTKTNVKVAGDAKLSNKFSVAGSISYIKSGGDRIQQGSNLSGLMLGLTRTAPTFDNTNGVDDPANDPLSYELADGTPRSYRPGIYDSPYWTVNKNPFKDDVNRMIGVVTLNYKPLNWLDVTYRIGNDFYNDRRKQVFDIGSGAYSAGQIGYDNHFERDVVSDLILTATKKLSTDLNGSFLIGNNIYSTYHEQQYTQGDGMSIPGFYDISNTSTVLNKNLISRKRTAAFYADAKLDYKSMLYLDLTGRNEWSTSLPDPIHNSFFFPSASLGFVFTEPLGMADNKYLPYGKLRVSYAQVGNDAPIYATTTTYQSTKYSDGWVQGGIGFPYQGVSGFNISSTIGSADLKPEISKSIELGTELRFYQNRFSLDFTYYTTKIEDEILTIPISAASGFQQLTLNAGKMKNSGFEIQLGATPIEMKDFSWNITANFSKNKSEVTELAPGIENVYLGGFESPQSRAVVGSPFGSLYGGRWLRDASGNVVIDDSGSSDPNAADYNPAKGFPIADVEEGIIGDPNPDWLAGIRNTFTYKGFSLSGLIDIRHGGDIWNGTEGALRSIGTSAATENRGDPFTFEGVLGHLDNDGNIVSSGTTNNQSVVLDENWYRLGNGSGFGAINEQFIQDGGWVRLRDITLSYTLNPKWFKKSFIRSAEFSVSGRNLWISTDYTGVDPETNLTGTGSFRANGFEYFNMPGTKSYSFSLRVTL